METLKQIIGSLNVHEQDTFLVRWVKIGSVVSIGIMIACSVFYCFLKFRAIISKKNTIDRSLDYDIFEWMPTDERRMFLDDVENYTLILPKVFRRQEYLKIRKEYETTLSTKRKNILFQEALIIVQQEAAIFQTGRTRDKGVT